MAQTLAPYSTGTLSVTNGSPNMVGSGTSFSDLNASAGSIITILGVDYTILTRTDATNLVLSSNYAGTTNGAATFKINTLVNPTPLANLETLNITNGVNVKITNALYTAAYPGVITITWGKLTVENTTENDLTFYNSGNMDVQGRGELIVNGQLRTIGTGTGASGQTVTYTARHKSFLTTLTTANFTSGSAAVTGTNFLSTYGCYAGASIEVAGVDYGILSVNSSTSMTLTSNYVGTTGAKAIRLIFWHKPSHLWVETGEGTNVYEKYTNVSFSTVATLRTVTMSYTGAGKYGLFFSQSMDSGTITFGNGTNGKCPPSGARIKVPNIVMASVLHADTLLFAGSGNVGKITLTGAQIPKRMTNINTGSASISQCCGTLARFISTSILTMDDCGYSADLGEVLLTTTPGSHLTITNSTFVSDRSTAGTGNINVNNVTLDGCTLIQYDNSTTDTALTINTANNAGADVVTLQNCLIVGASKLYGITHLNNCELVENLMANSTVSSSSKYLVTMALSGGSHYFDNVTIPDHVKISALGIFYASNLTLAMISLRNCNILTTAVYYLYSVAATTPVEIINTFIHTPTNPINTSDVTIKNVRSNTYTLVIASATPGVMRGHPCASVNTGLGANWKDNFISEWYTSATTGLIVFFYPPKVNFAGLTTTGSALTDNAGKYYLPYTGDSVTLETTTKILGVSALTGVANNTFTGGTYEYAVDTGSGYGSWKELTAANVQGETVDKDAGFLLKLRATATTDSFTTVVETARITTTVDQTVLYPTSLVTLQLDNIVTGSTYRISKTSDNSQIVSDTANSSSVSVAGIPYFSDVPVTIRVRKAGYVPFETGGTITSAGLTTFVSQTEDTIYQ